MIGRVQKKKEKLAIKIQGGGGGGGGGLVLNNNRK